jgi:cysteine-rich repeat protein
MRGWFALALLTSVGCSSSAKMTPAGMDMSSGTGGNGAVCGNGIVEGTESCDDGPLNGVNDKCTAFCAWACNTDATCDDKNACNGAETCTNHQCAPGTPLSDGSDCGGGMICESGSCGAAKCGDGVVSGTEECDDGNVTNGDGCDSNCKYSCVSTDTTRNCTPSDACAGQGTCNDSKHVCTPGTPLSNGTACTGGSCMAGVCTKASCGNGIVEAGEQCDDGALNGTKADGCSATCTYVCSTPKSDCGAPPACEIFSCAANHTCLVGPDASLDGSACGSGLVCKSGACIGAAAVCGNGIVETGEQCDFGSGNGANTGCGTNCQYSCQDSTNCDDGNACNGAETCGAVTVGTGSGKKCSPGTPPANGTDCGTSGICEGTTCMPSTCGDGLIDSGRGETCDPPNSTTCDTACHTIVCGDGVRAPGSKEQCDDGNTSNLDGCDSTCKFEQIQRANSLTMSFNTSVCAKNQLGAAIVDTTTAQPDLQTALTNGIADGSVTIELAFNGLDDLTGTSSTAPFSLGVLHATPTAGTGYNGASDLDWWYPTDTASINANRQATSVLMNGKFAASKLTTDPGTAILGLVLAGSPASLTMYNTVMTASVTAAATTPTVSSAGATPGHLASEHLDPTLKSFPSMTGGKLCGDISAGSLANVIMPDALITNCSEGYTTSNHLLDAIVHGCTKTIVIFNITVIAATQPDGSTDGKTYKFTTTGNSVTGCTGGAAWPACLANAWYSGAFQFTADRVIAK